MNHRRPSYHDYRRYGHSPAFATALAAPFWVMLTLSLLVGVIIGLVLAS